MKGLWDWICSASKRPYLKYSFNELLKEASSIQASEIKKVNQIKEELTYRKRLKLEKKKLILAELLKSGTDNAAANQVNETQNEVQDLEQGFQSISIELDNAESGDKKMEVINSDIHATRERIKDEKSKSESKEIRNQAPDIAELTEASTDLFYANDKLDSEKLEKKRNEKPYAEKNIENSKTIKIEGVSKGKTRSTVSDKRAQKKGESKTRRHKILPKSISDLPLTLRVQNSLFRSRIQNIFDLKDVNLNDLYGFKNFGQKSVEELVECLHKENLLSEPLRISYEEGALFDRNSVNADCKHLPLIIDVSSFISESQSEKLAEASKLADFKEKNSVQKEDERIKSIDEIAARIKSTLEVIKADKLFKEAIREIVEIQISFSEMKNDHALDTLTVLEEEALSPSAVVIVGKMILVGVTENIANVPISPKQLEDEKLVKAIIKQMDKEVVETRLKFLYRQFIKDSLLRLCHEDDVRSTELKEEMSNLVLNQAFCDGSLAQVRERAKKIEVADDLIKGFNILKQRIAGMTLASIGEMNDVTRERIRQIERGFISKYKLKSLKTMSQDFEAKINDREKSDQFDRILNETYDIPATGDLSILANRVDAYRYFYCPIPSIEYNKHLMALEALVDRKIIGTGYWDLDGFNLRGILWAFSAKSNSFGLMPKQLTLPRCVSAAVQRIGGQAAVANRFGMKYQGQIRGTDGRTYWDKDKILEYINKVQKEYFLPSFLMPDKQQLREFVDEQGQDGEKGNSCISAITNQYTLQWIDAAKVFGLKAYESCTVDDLVEIRIIWNIFNNVEVESRDYLVKQIWRGEDKLQRTENLIGIYRQICAIGDISVSSEEEFIKVARNSMKQTDEAIIDDIADMLF